MRKVLFLSLAALLAGCSDNAASKKAHALAAAMQALAPKALSHGLTMTGAEADGATVVLRFSGVPDHYSQWTAEQLQSQLNPLACNSDGYRGMIDGGNPVRFELSTNGGTNLPAVTVSQCQ